MYAVTRSSVKSKTSYVTSHRKKLIYVKGHLAGSEEHMVLNFRVVSSRLILWVEILNK